MTSKVDLVYPLYLNVPMMTSFLAAFEDGIAYDSDVVRKQDKKREAGGEGEGRFGIPGLGSILNLDLRGKVTESNSAGNSEEIKLVRKHTEASLFMRLRQELFYRDQIVKIENSDELAKIAHSSLVEVTGPISINPLNAAFEGFDQLGELFNVELYNPTNQSRANTSAKKAPTSQNQKKLVTDFRTEDVDTKKLGMKVLGRVREELKASKVKDVLMRPPSFPDFTVLIGLTAEFLSEGAFDNFLSGYFTVLGKTVRVLKPDEEINLYQRTIVGIMGKDTEMALAKLLDVSWVKQNMALIKYPAIQLIPLAIFV